MADLDQTHRVTADELRQFIEQIERLDAGKAAIADLKKEVMAEAKGRGYDRKALTKLIALRRADASDLAEQEAILDLYKSVLGM